MGACEWVGISCAVQSGTIKICRASRSFVYIDMYVDLDSSSSGVRVDCRRAASTTVPDNHQSNT